MIRDDWDCFNYLDPEQASDVDLRELVKQTRFDKYLEGRRVEGFKRLLSPDSRALKRPVVRGIFSRLEEFGSDLEGVRAVVENIPRFKLDRYLRDVNGFESRLQSLVPVFEVGDFDVSEVSGLVKRFRGDLEVVYDILSETCAGSDGLGVGLSDWDWSVYREHDRVNSDIGLLRRVDNILFAGDRPSFARLHVVKGDYEPLGELLSEAVRKYPGEVRGLISEFSSDYMRRMSDFLLSLYSVESEPDSERKEYSGRDRDMVRRRGVVSSLLEEDSVMARMTYFWLCDVRKDGSVGDGVLEHVFDYAVSQPDPVQGLIDQYTIDLFVLQNPGVERSGLEEVFSEARVRGLGVEVDDSGGLKVFDDNPLESGYRRRVFDELEAEFLKMKERKRVSEEVCDDIDDVRALDSWKFAVMVARRDEDYVTGFLRLAEQKRRAWEEGRVEEFSWELANSEEYLDFVVDDDLDGFDKLYTIVNLVSNAGVEDLVFVRDAVPESVLRSEWADYEVAPGEVLGASARFDEYVRSVTGLVPGSFTEEAPLEFRQDVAEGVLKLRNYEHRPALALGSRIYDSLSDVGELVSLCGEFYESEEARVIFDGVREYGSDDVVEVLGLISRMSEGQRRSVFEFYDSESSGVVAGFVAEYCELPNFDDVVDCCPVDYNRDLARVLVCFDSQIGRDVVNAIGSGVYSPESVVRGAMADSDVNPEILADKLKSDYLSKLVE